MPIRVLKVLVLTEAFFLLPEKGRLRRPFSLVLTLLLSIAACQTGPEPGATADGLVTRVDHVVDGDTVWVDDLGESVRLIGIDTPEIDPEQECFGEEARDRLNDLIPGGTRVVIRFDIEEFDRFGRYLGYVFRQTDGLFVNQVMVEEGLAKTLRIEPNIRFADELREAEEEAVGRGLGLWSTC
jgi:micrococcal nuclease